MAAFLFSVSLPLGSDGLSPTSIWAAEGANEEVGTVSLQRRLPHGFKIIEMCGVANDRLSEALALSTGEASELSSGIKRKRD